MASSWILSVKVASISACVLSTALLLKLSFPALLEFLSCELPYLWLIVATCLKPPYLYLLLNCIILTIVASSKLQPQKSETDGVAVASRSVQSKAPEELSFADQSPIKGAFGPNDDVPVVSPVLFGYVDEMVEEILESRPEEETVEAIAPTAEGIAAAEVSGAIVTENEEFALSMSDWIPPQKTNPVEDYSVSTEKHSKPPVSRRIGYRKSVKASPEGGKALLGVSKLKRQETLESTWRMITEGRPMPLTRHLKKSDTWETQGRGARHDDSPSASPAHLMKKSETFNDGATSNDSGSVVRLRREPSLSQDELNRRVEAFINKFNQEMRLQRQHSLNKYMEMVGPTSGTH